MTTKVSLDTVMHAKSKSVVLTTAQHAVLDWVSIYWFSRAGPTAAARIYYEFKFDDLPPWTPIPYGASYFPKEIVRLPKLYDFLSFVSLAWLAYTAGRWMRTVGDVVYEAEHDSGGHFAAYEKPNELADDLKTMFSQEKLWKPFK